MKRIKNIISLSIVSFLLFSCGDNAKSDMVIGEYTTLEVNDVFDGGTVIKGAIVRAEFEVKNTGDYPLVIADIRPACSCTVSEYEQDPIAPGESTTIVASVDTDKLNTGVINKPVTVTANTKPSTTTLTIKATVTH